MKKIEITIDTEGRSIIKTSGFLGSACKDITKEIEKALGSVTNREYTSEYYQTGVKAETHSVIDNGCP